MRTKQLHMTKARRLAALAPRTLGACVVMIALAGPAQAEMMAYEFTGLTESVTDPNNVLNGSVLPGATFSGLFTFDSDAQDLRNTSPVWGDYRGPLFSMKVNFGPYSGSSAGSENAIPMILTANNSSGGDGLTLSADDFRVTEQLELTSASVGLADYTGSAFLDDSLPVQPLDLSDFQATSFLLKGSSTLGFGMFVIGGSLTSFNVVPEPSCILLAAVGFLLFYDRSAFRFSKP